MSSLPSHRYEQAQEPDPTPQHRSCLPELAPFLKPSLSVRRKITLGYALAVSIPVLGALLGLVVGNRYQTTATQTLTTTYQEQRNLTNLQVLILQNRPAKDLTPLIQNPAAYRQASSKILGRIDQIQTLVNQLEAAETLSILKFKPQLKTYQSVLATFSQEFKTLAQDIQLLQRSNNDKLIQKKNSGISQWK